MTYSTEFELFWTGLPKPMKKSKGYASECFGRLMKKPDAPTVKELSKAIRDQKKERAFLKRKGRFVAEWKNASTWLNQNCFEDDCELPLRVTKTTNTPRNGVDSMSAAYAILCRDGEGKFQEFCAGTRMPAGDVEAVRFKHSGKYDIEPLVRGIG